MSNIYPYGILCMIHRLPLGTQKTMTVGAPKIREHRSQIHLYGSARVFSTILHVVLLDMSRCALCLVTSLDNAQHPSVSHDSKQLAKTYHKILVNFNQFEHIQIVPTENRTNQINRPISTHAYFETATPRATFTLLQINFQYEFCIYSFLVKRIPITTLLVSFYYKVITTLSRFWV